MTISEDQNFCICTAAFGQTYRALAKNLAGDVEKHSPNVPLIIFTDKPKDFQEYKKALVFKHRQVGVLSYHERRFAIAKALSMYRSCLYMDADVRLCAPIPNNLEWQPGITARSSTNMLKHIQSRLLDKNQKPRPGIVKQYEFVQRMASKLGLDLERDNVTWINEFMFVVTRDEGREKEFLDLWGKFAIFSELNGRHKGPAYAIGLAAAKVGFPIQRDEMPGIDFFDDRVENVKIANGEAKPEDKKEYFEAQKKIEQAKRSVASKAIAKVNKFVSYYYHSLRLRLSTLGSPDSDFYYH